MALDALVRVDEGAYSHVLVPSLLRDSALGSRDRAWVTDIVYRALRRQRSIDYLLATVMDRPIADLDPPVRSALRLGAAQLLEGVPPHAAVSETVDAVAHAQPRARGYVNAVLRRVAELGPPWPFPTGDDVVSLGVRASHPDWIVRLLVDQLGPEDALGVLEAANEAPTVTLRPNPLRTTPEDLAAELAAAGIDVEAGRLVPTALSVRGTGDPARLPAVVEGRATPQDQASQAVVRAVGVAPGQRVLEVGAGPGGKATALAEALGGTGHVVALDVHPGRGRLVADAARRLGLDRVSVVVADGRALPLVPGTFDRVLLDAPCSGLGVLRRRAEARWRVQPDAVEALAALQRDLLGAAAAALAPGGILVYSVCTLSDAETLGVDRWAQATLPELHVATADALGSPWRPHGRGALLLPQDAGTDGMYVLALERSA